MPVALRPGISSPFALRCTCHPFEIVAACADVMDRAHVAGILHCKRDETDHHVTFTTSAARAAVRCRSVDGGLVASLQNKLAFAQYLRRSDGDPDLDPHQRAQQIRSRGFSPLGNQWTEISCQVLGRLQGGPVLLVGGSRQGAL